MIAMDSYGEASVTYDYPVLALPVNRPMSEVQSHCYSEEDR